MKIITRRYYYLKSNSSVTVFTKVSYNVTCAINKYSQLAISIQQSHSWVANSSSQLIEHEGLLSSLNEPATVPVPDESSRHLPILFH